MPQSYLLARYNHQVFIEISWFVVINQYKTLSPFYINDSAYFLRIAIFICIYFYYLTVCILVIFNRLSIALYIISREKFHLILYFCSWN